MPSFFGKYRGKVAGNKDPLHLGRIQVAVPSILGDRLSWAMPCVPYAGADVGFFAIPPIGTNIWVEFESGDPDYPIWTGCFWATDQLPVAARVEDPAKVQMFRTPGFTILLDNLGSDKGFSIVVDAPVVQRKLKLTLDANGIELNNKDDLTVKVLADRIELKNRTDESVTISTDRLELKSKSTSAKLSSTAIDFICTPAILKLNASTGIEINNPPVVAKFNASGIDFAATPSAFKMSPAQVELSNTAANVKLSAAIVNVNNGALEVL